MNVFQLLMLSASFQRRPSSPLVDITQQPQGLTATEGANAVLSVAALNAVGYQWYRVASPDIALTGATNSSLDLGTLSSEEAGQYYVQISNADGIKVKTDVVLVVVNPAPVYYAGAFIQYGDSNTATASGNPDASKSNPAPLPFVMSNGGTAKTIWRAIGNPKMSVNVFGFPGETAAIFNTDRRAQVAAYIKQDLPNQYVYIPFGTNDLVLKSPQDAFNDLKSAYEWARTAHPIGTKFIASGVPNRIGGAQADFYDDAIEFNNLLKANFESGNGFMDIFVNIFDDPRVSAASVANDPTKMNQADKDGYAGVHFLQPLCDLIAENIAPKVIQSGFQPSEYDLSGGVDLPAIDVLPTQEAGLAPVNIAGPVNGVYKNSTFNADTINWNSPEWNGNFLLPKKIPARQEGYFQFQQPYEGRFAILGIRTTKENTAFPGYLHRIHSGGAMAGFDTDTGEQKTQLFQGQWVRVSIKNIGGKRHALMYRSCLDKKYWTYEGDLGEVGMGEILCNINIRQDGAMALPQVSSNCIDI